MEHCIFCKLANREIPTEFVFENDCVVAFRDMSPQAPIHILVLPKEHISSLDGVNAENSKILAEIFEAIPKIAKKLDIFDNYRVISNCGENVGQSVKHLHFHMLSGSKTLKERIL